MTWLQELVQQLEKSLLRGETAVRRYIGGSRFASAVSFVLGLQCWALLTLASPLEAAEPANDRFTKPQRLTGLVGSVAGSNLGATKQAGEPTHGDTAGGHSVWYRWTAPYPMQVTFTTDGSAFDTVLAVYIGNSLTTLALIASNDNSSALVTSSAVSFTASGGADYAIAIDGVGDAQGDLALSWSTVPFNDNFKDFQLLHEISGDFAGDSTGAGVELQEVANLGLGDDIGSTVWFAWPSTVSGQVTFTTAGSAFDTVIGVYTGSDFGALTQIAFDDNGGGADGTSSVTWTAESGARYRIVIGGRNAASGSYNLSWNQTFPPPVNDTFLGARSLFGFTGQTLGDNLGGTVEPSEPLHATNSSQASVWFVWTATRSGTVRWVTERSLFPTVVAAYTGTDFSDLTSVARSEDQGQGLAGEMAFVAKEDQQYWIALDGQGGARGLYILQWTYDDLTTPNNDFQDATVISNSMGRIFGENYYSDHEAGEPFHAGDAGGKSVWYTWTAPTSYRVAFETTGSNFDTLLAVYTGANPVAGLKLIDEDDDFNGRLTSKVAFEAVAGQTYHIAVDGSTDHGIKSAPIGMIVLTWSPSAADFVALVPSQGMIGSKLRVMGPDLANVVSVFFGLVESEFVLDEDALVVTVPSGATSGPLKLLSSDGTDRNSSQDFTLLVGSPPVLAMRLKSSDTVQLAWSSQYPEFQLQWSYNLTSAAQWQLASGAPVQVGGELVVEETVDQGRLTRFYRLVVP